jgi:hypothetical protein
MKKGICLMMVVGAMLLTNAAKGATKPETWGDCQFVNYPTTQCIFYGSDIDTTQDWNICVGDTDGGVEVHMTQQILPIQNSPGHYVIVRRYTTPDGSLIKQTIKRFE